VSQFLKIVVFSGDLQPRNQDKSGF